jgi:hypothetical protein
MPERSGVFYEGAGLRGRGEAAILAGELTLNETGGRGFEAMGHLALDGVHIGTTDGVDNLNGIAEGRIRLDAEEGVQEVKAEYRVEAFDIRGRRVDRLSGQLVYDPNERVLASRNFAAELGGGAATGTATLTLPVEGSFLAYTLGLSFEDISVDRIVALPESSSAGESVQRGKAAGTLTLQGRIGQAESTEGRLSAAVSKMRLGRQS